MRVVAKVYNLLIKVTTTPAVRFLIKKFNLLPELIKPTGKNSRILKEDVLNFINSLKHPLPPKHAQEDMVEKLKEKKPSKEFNYLINPKEAQDDKIVKIAGFQKAMTKTMSQASQIPSFLYTDEFNVDKLVNLRKEINSIDKGKFKMTFMPFFIKAVSLALLEYPGLNSIVNSKIGDDGYICEYTIKKEHNISVAIDSPEGLVVPNIKSVQNKSLIQIQKELILLRDKVEAKKLNQDDLKDGTFTVSNIGNIGGKVLSPVILPPQTAIIGISKIFDALTLVPKDGDYKYKDVHAYQIVKKKDLAVLFHKSVNLCISADHRIHDGATIARFSEVLKSYIENPLKIWINN